MTSVVRKVRRAVIRADLDRLSRANHAADIVEEVYRQAQKWKAICAEQGVLLEGLVAKINELTDKHNTLVSYLKARGHLSNDEGLVTTPGGILVRPDTAREILKSIGR